MMKCKLWKKATALGLALGVGFGALAGLRLTGNGHVGTHAASLAEAAAEAEGTSPQDAAPQCPAS